VEAKASNLQKVFVTGGSSDLIRSVIDLLPTKMFEVICLTRQHIEQKDRDISWHVGDLLKPETYGQLIRNCDVVLHAAAITHTINEREYYDVNLEGTKKLLSVLEPNTKTRFIFISSRTASEESGAYGKSKLMAEKVIKESVGNWLILRPSEIFGGSKSEGIDKAIESAMLGGIQLCPAGVQTPMYPIHTQDAARLIYQCGFVEKETNKIVHINGPLPYSFYNLIKSVSRIAGKRVLVIPIPKIMLLLIAQLVKITKIDVGIVPDQVARLYSTKQHEVVESTFITIEEFVKAKLT